MTRKQSEILMTLVYSCLYKISRFARNDTVLGLFTTTSYITWKQRYTVFSGFKGAKRYKYFSF